jgi:hypothetical protein
MLYIYCTVCITLLLNIFGVLECARHCFAYVTHLVFLRNVKIETQSAAVESGCATNVSTHKIIKRKNGK